MRAACPIYGDFTPLDLLLAPDGHETPRGPMQARSIKTNLPSLFLAGSVVLVLVAWVASLVYVAVRYI